MTTLFSANLIPSKLLNGFRKGSIAADYVVSFATTESTGMKSILATKTTSGIIKEIRDSTNNELCSIPVLGVTFKCENIKVENIGIMHFQVLVFSK